MARNLVLTRVGTASLHPGWLDGAGPRTWDVRLAPYQPIEEQAGRGCDVGEVIVGPKWSGIREVLKGWDGWRDYDYIWLPDDDIATGPEAITRMFEVAAGVGLDLFAPALDEASYYAHFDTMRNRRFFGRWTGFVEIMIPGFSRRAMEELLPTLDHTQTGWGWGLDSVWPKLLGYENVGIIDGVTVTHTRPVGVMRDPDLRRRVLAESDALLERYDCRQEHVTFGAFDADLQPVELSPEQLLVELVQGADHLIERDPRVLSWIASFQASRFPPPDYPVAGTP
ncbi:MAG TPA: hypothetical protein VD931_14890 [Baekduia sp.]|nr:hypothetical protein [Baekduia sp.]